MKAISYGEVNLLYGHCGPSPSFVYYSEVGEVQAASQLAGPRCERCGPQQEASGEPVFCGRIIVVGSWRGGPQSIEAEVD